MRERIPVVLPEVQSAGLRSTVGCRVLAHRRHDNAILQSLPANREWLEKSRHLRIWVEWSARRGVMLRDEVRHAFDRRVVGAGCHGSK